MSFTRVARAFALATTNRSITSVSAMNPYWLILLFSASAHFVVFLRWLHRLTRDNEISRAFVRDMATNHLPHIYHALRVIAAHHGLELGDPPPVRFVDLSRKERTER